MNRAIVVLLMVVSVVFADKKMCIYYSDGTVHTGVVSTVDSITFKEMDVLPLCDTVLLYNSWASRACAVDFTSGKTFKPLSIDDEGVPLF